MATSIRPRKPGQKVVNTHRFFSKLYDEGRRALMDLIRESPAAAGIFLQLSELCSDGRKAAVISQATLAELTGFHRLTVKKAITDLEQKRLIAVYRLEGAASAYAINANVEWRLGEGEKEYALFNAALVISKSENSRLEKLQKITTIIREDQIIYISLPNPGEENEKSEEESA
jgi:DNA-binding transcriptional regulator YhcF (GntR family)